MSTDEHSLAQWLDAPTSDPESTLDPEVLEAVYAMRPDLAPAPRVTADDILASVTDGPLAATAPTVPSSLPSPNEGSHTAAPAPANRSLASWGGWGGIGLALAAAATFALVGLPTLQGSAPDMAAPTMELDEAPAAAAAPAAQEKAAPLDTGAALKRQAEAKEAPAKPAGAKPRSRPTPRPAPPPPPAEVPAVAQVPAADGAYDMAEGAPLRDQNLIPELAETEEELADDGVAAVAEPDPEPTDSPPSDAVEAEEARRLDALRANATSVMPPVPSWKSGLAPTDVQRLEALFAEAASKSPRDAGDQVSEAIQAPAAVAHHAARLAIDYYLAAGDSGAAASAAIRGLQFRTSDAGWASLAVRYADLIRSSDPTEAARWYEDAAAAVR